MILQAKATRNKWLDFGIPVFVLTTISIAFRFTDWDLQLAGMFYHPKTGWYMQDQMPWHFIFYYGNIPGILLVLTGIVALSMSFWAIKYKKLRKKALFLVTVLALGPGLMVNGLLKEHWGRPRPRAVEQFGGNDSFKCVCQDGFQGEGKSFPCGHCSMAFYLLVPYFIYRHNRRRLANIFLIGGIAFGLLMGLSRMIAGGHFASDVLWAGGIVYLFGVALDHLLRLDIDPPIDPAAVQQKRKPITIVLTVLAAHLVIFGLLLATPYKRNSQFPLDTDGMRLEQFKSNRFEFKKADVLVRLSDKTRASWDAHGFGFPGSRLNPHWRETSDNNMPVFWLDQKGIFTEFSMQLELELFPHNQSAYLLQLGEGSATIALGTKLDSTMELSVEIVTGTLIVDTKLTPSFIVQQEQGRFINDKGIALQEISAGVYATSPDAKLTIKVNGDVAIR